MPQENSQIQKQQLEKNTNYIVERNKEDNTSTQFKEGQEIEFLRVRFSGNANSFQFIKGKRNYLYGQKVVAMSDRGIDVGYINSIPYKLKFNKKMLPLKSIIREATTQDIHSQLENIKKEKEAEVFCNKLIEKYKLKMNITHVQLLQFGKKIVFYFNAPNRVDFRELIKELISSLKLRIELRQISIRDRAACIGSVASCGQITCCSSFLKSYGGSSIKMAKNQNLSLIPGKLNGMCGQIKCCIKYEDNVYTHKRQKLPRVGQLIQTMNGDRGNVKSIQILQETFVMITEKGQIRKYEAGQFSKSSQLPKDWTFPKELFNIINETHIIIKNDDRNTQ